jgi:hypothetical protein
MSIVGEKNKSAAERKAELMAERDRRGGRHKSISQHFGLDAAKPREQAIANSFIKGFDRDHFQRLVVQWVVNTNRPFTDQGWRLSIQGHFVTVISGRLTQMGN